MPTETVYDVVEDLIKRVEALEELMTTWHDFDKIERENIRLLDEVKNATNIVEKYLSSHAAYYGSKKCYCDTCQLAEAWLQRNKG